MPRFCFSSAAQRVRPPQEMTRIASPDGASNAPRRSIPPGLFPIWKRRENLPVSAICARSIDARSLGCSIVAIRDSPHRSPQHSLLLAGASLLSSTTPGSPHIVAISCAPSSRIG
ncbi:hypothetical protein P171DRAFT_85103 [Karstenula rhodostoma CBS 690.94]|uniref:Uncharacterized protein n=1 Tax=Karstenula rhodostoma CBS 690.94 TaxID=1392251 RepID=A0A9P4U868_9PLEO|nr:hypothetical protein P171DRAFT_85103 [Karstenula rhodostoma CBS 690.94]